MIPQKLSLRNFMCYRDDGQALDFAGIRLACISGDNGNGKSALLDAITWALWGKARAKTDDELINLLATEMEVEFQFLLGQNSYRVIRKRSKLQKGQTLLELQVHDSTGWRSITGNTIRDTERKIVDLLRMEYDTFINSTFLLQGRADEFTMKPPTQRKQILADILGLSVYDELEAKAKEQARRRAEAADALAQALQEIDAELAHLPEYEQAALTAASQVATLTESLRAAEEELRCLRDQKALLDARSRQAADLRVRIDHAEAELADARRNLAEQNRRLADHEALIAQAQQIEAGYTELQSVRKQADDLGRKLSLLMHLQEEKARLEQTIASQRHALDSARQVLAAQVADRQAKAAQLDALRLKAAELRRQAERLQSLESQREALRERVLDLSARQAGLRTANEQLRADMEALKRKIAELAGVSRCPLCSTELTPEHREDVRNQYVAEGREKADAFRANQAQMERLAAEVSAVQQQMAQADAALKSLPGLQRQEATAEQELAQAQQAATELASLQQQLATHEARLAQEDYASDERLKLAGILRQMAAVGYDKATHDRLQQRLAELTPFELRHTRLESARQDVDAEREAVARYARQIARYEETIAADRDKLNALSADLAGLEALARRLATQQATVDALLARDRDARLQLGAAQQRVTACRQQAEVRKERAAQEAKARQERAIYEELALAFGKRGLQAMLIEEALPELEEEANRLLGRMTDNRFHVRFETQRETKKGDTVETLDIKIADEVGIRNYETYSGGEAFRINFSIRVALSKLLAHRAGARLQTLVVDEGFGTQDAQGRERLVEVINSIQDEFEMILAITHIQELKDAFPVHIEVTKTAAGSQITVT